MDISESEWLRSLPVIRCKVMHQGPTMDCSVHSIHHALSVMREIDTQADSAARGLAVIVRKDRTDEVVDVVGVRTLVQDYINALAAGTGQSSLLLASFQSPTYRPPFYHTRMLHSFGFLPFVVPHIVVGYLAYRIRRRHGWHSW
jgi:hypothetical protein